MTRTNTADEHRLRLACEETLRRAVGAPFAAASPRARGEAPAAYRLDLPGGPRIRVRAEIRRNVRPGLVPQLAAAWEREVPNAHPEHRALFADYVSAPLAEALRAAGVWFADAVGNAYLDVPGRLLVYTVGHRPERAAAPKGQYFTESGAKVLFFLLRNGPVLDATYRSMQSAVGVSLDKISKVLTELAHAQALAARGRGRYEILDSGRLLDWWVDAFAAKLAPRILLGRYRAPAEEGLSPWVREHAAALASSTVGGEVAADALTGHLRPARLRLYIPTDQEGAIQRALKLAPSSDGNVELCRAFARGLDGGEEEGLRLAHPILVYAELLAADDARLGETAVRLKERYLTWID